MKRDISKPLPLPYGTLKKPQDPPTMEYVKATIILAIGVAVGVLIHGMWAVVP